jgi:hypothetical protein
VREEGEGQSPVVGGRRKEEGGRRKEEGGRRKEEVVLPVVSVWEGKLLTENTGDHISSNQPTSCLRLLEAGPD